MISDHVRASHSDSDGESVDRNSCRNFTVVRHPDLHLVTYAEKYDSYSRITRLRFIAKVCPTLRAEALTLALNHVKSTYNVKLYDELHKSLRLELRRQLDNSKASAAASSSAATSTWTEEREEAGAVELVPYDSQWVEGNTMEATLLQQELVAELKFKKSNSGNAYVRGILEEIGDYHVKSGNLHQAIKSYARARPYCTHSDHVINMFRNLICVSIYMANWWHVLSYIDQAKHYAQGFEYLARSTPIRLSCATGLAQMGLKNYKSAAQCFLRTPYDTYDYAHIVSPLDVVHYACLCALATLEREALHVVALNSETFKPFFDHDPKMWDLLAKFYAHDYEYCMQILKNIEEMLRLDVYLAPHVDTLYDKILSRFNKN